MSRNQKTQEEPVVQTTNKPGFSIDWSGVLSWGGTFLLVGVLVLVLLKIDPFNKKTDSIQPLTASNPVNVPLPSLASGIPVDTLMRLANLDTKIPDGVRYYAVKYTVEEGDSIFAIAKKFNITAESILWANYDLLQDDPTIISPGWRLTIPPVNGVYYKWQEGDTLEKVAAKFHVDPGDITIWPGNHLDVSNPESQPLDFVMVPGGYRELVSWIKTMPFAPRSGATRVVAGPGGCQAPATGPVGSGNFVWPVNSHSLSGFGFSSYHLGIDLSAGVGTPVVAADAGTVIYSGWNDSGYGWLIEIDHNNGYSTIYAHLSEGTLAVQCGDSVGAGQYIALSGSSGKSTGGHLHFEIRDNGSFVDPYTILP